MDSVVDEDSADGVDFVEDSEPVEGVTHHIRPRQKHHFWDKKSLSLHYGMGVWGTVVGLYLWNRLLDGLCFFLLPRNWLVFFCRMICTLYPLLTPSSGVMTMQYLFLPKSPDVRPGVFLLRGTRGTRGE